MASLSHIYPEGFKPDQSRVIDQSPVDAFLSKMSDHGLMVETVQADGKIHQALHVDDKKSNPSGWYVLHGDGIPAGAFGNHRYDECVKWRHDIGRSLTQQELQNWSRTMEQINAERELIQQRQWQEAANMARELIATLPDADSDHEYLKRKQVKAVAGLKLEGLSIVMPIVNSEGDITSVQRINAHGRKTLLKGGQKKGCFFEINGQDDTVYICEGLSTGLSLYEITGNTIIVAVDCANLTPVAHNIRKSRPTTRIIIAADNDQFGAVNAGREAAIKAAEAINASVVMPEFDGVSTKPTDWNDFMVLYGKDKALERLQTSVVQKQSSLNIVRADQLNMAEFPVDWLIKGYLEAHTLNMLIAPPASYKSFLALDWGLCLAAGIHWNEQKVKQKRAVVFIIGEGQRGVKRRIKSWMIKHQMDIDGLPVYLSDRAARLFDDHNALKVELEGLGVDIDLLVFDTLNRNSAGAAENDTKDMTMVVSNVDDIRQHFKCAALIVHHTPLSDAKRARGSNSVFASVDSEFLLEADNTALTATLSCTKMKDFEQPDKRYFQARVIDLGDVDEDGAPITSLVLDGLDGLQGFYKLGDKQEQLLNAIKAVSSEQSPDSNNEIWVDYDAVCTEQKLTKQQKYDLKVSLTKKNFIDFKGRQCRVIGDK